MTASPAPDWLVAEMPPGYQTRFTEIQRLSAEMHAMDRFARLLWETGPALREAVVEAFGALKYDIESPPADAALLIVRLDARRRLLVHVAEGDGLIEKKSPELAHVFRLVHEIGGDDDRAVLVTSGDPALPPKARGADVSPEALKLLGRLGVNVMPAATLFSVWSLAQMDAPHARTYVDKFHAMDGGTAPPAKS
jgi:hypothetical protein